MKLTASIAALALLGLAACQSADDASEAADVAMRTGTPEAEAACLDGVNVQTGGAPAEVTSSEFSEAGSLVTIVAGGQTWNCTAANDGAIAEVVAAS